MDKKYKKHIEELVALNNCSAVDSCPGCPMYKYCSDMSSTMENDVVEAKKILKEVL